jgi:hypothetical protein
MVVWQSDETAGPEVGRVKARRYAADGSPLGAEFEVSAASYYQVNTAPRVDSWPSGESVVVWEKDEWGEVDAVFRRVDAAGAPQGAPTVVSASSANEQTNPDVAALPSGQFVVVWTDFDTYGTSLQGRVFAGDGTPAVAQFRVDGMPTEYRHHEHPAVAGRSDSSFVVVWESEEWAAGGDFDVFAGLLAATGVALAPPFTVHEVDSDDQRDPAVAVLADDTPVVVWETPAIDPSFAAGLDIVGRTLGESAPSGAQFQVTDNVDYVDSRDPAVAVSGSQMAVVWRNDDWVSDAPKGVVGRLYRAGPAGPSEWFDVASEADYVPPAEQQPALAWTSSGRFDVVWDTTDSPGGDASGRAVAARVMRSNVVFVDGFESGSPSLWSAAVN